jgi:hypothetical protein
MLYWKPRAVAPTAPIVVITAPIGAQARRRHILSGRHSRDILVQGTSNSSSHAYLTRKRIVLALAIAGASTLVGYGVWRALSRDLPGRILNCVRANQCNGIPCVSGGQSIGADQLSNIFAQSSLRAAANRISRCYSTRAPDGHSHFFLTADCGKGTQVFQIYSYESKDGDGIVLGSLVISVLAIDERAKHPDMTSLGELYGYLSADFGPVAQTIAAQGISSIDVVGTEHVNVDTAADALGTLATYNRDVKLRVIRP